MKRRPREIRAPYGRISRRRLLETGCLSTLGLSWPYLLRAKAATTEQPRNNGFGQARSCVVVFMWGGPGQQDLWDLKPLAPAAQRSEFSPVATSVSGIQISDQLPHVCQQADKFTIVRSVTHRDFEHGSAAYSALTGHPHPKPGTNTPVSPDDFPTYGAVVSKLGHNTRSVPDAVTLGPVMHQGNRPPIAGQNAGFLGLGHEPFRIANNPNGPDFSVGGLEVPPDVPSNRLQGRHRLLQSLDESLRRAQAARLVTGMSDLYDRAFGLLRSAQTQRAFDLSHESPALRDRYGRHKFGQTLLLARRLVEAEVPLITVNWEKQNGNQWDTHNNNYPRLKKLLPPFDRGFAAFLEDLHDRGLLDTTLVLCLGEFGRTPAINKDAGRDHWPDCYSVVMGGGGVHTGRVFGASNRNAAYPISHDVGPWDLSATVFHCLGIRPEHHIHDSQGRPFVVSPGRVIDGLL